MKATTAGVGWAEFLAAAPKLWDRWQNEQATDVQPAGAAIVSAAVDCWRAGRLDVLSEELLRELYPVYLDGRTVSILEADGFEASLAWAMIPVHATSALLTRIDGGYRVFDYLVDRVQSSPKPPAIPDAVWRGLVVHLSADDV